MTTEWTEKLVAQALYRHFVWQSWWPLTQVTVNDPAHRRTEPLDPARSKTFRRIDMLMFRTPRKEGLGQVEMLAIEIKTARPDLLADVRDPGKQAAWREVAHRHAYAIPAGLADPREIPAASGVITLDSNLGLKWARRAPYSTTAPDLPAQLVIALAARASQAEARLKGLSSDASDDMEGMRAELEQLRREARKLADQNERLSDKLSAWRTACAAVAGVPCWGCGQLVKPSRYAQQGVIRWRHVQPADEARCARARRHLAAEAARLDWERDTDGQGRSYQEKRARDRGIPPWELYLTVLDVGPAEDLAPAQAVPIP
uniref:hypothetical protein n=1 Tax=Nonomuraea sp. CA-251285 TaxID=3240002 RepID=UPI003F494991